VDPNLNTKRHKETKIALNVPSAELTDVPNFISLVKTSLPDMRSVHIQLIILHKHGCCKHDLICCIAYNAGIMWTFS